MEQPCQKVQSYRGLMVWQVGMGLATACYEITRTFPKEERYGLTSQIRRAATSVPANIAEGYGRENTGEYVHFLRYAQGSLKEVETLLLLSEMVNITEEDSVTPLLHQADELGRMLRALIRKLQARKG